MHINGYQWATNCHLLQSIAIHAWFETMPIEGKLIAINRLIPKFHETYVSLSKSGYEQIPFTLAKIYTPQY